MTGIIAEKVYNPLAQQVLLQEEQKDYRKTFRGISNLLYIDRAFIREVKFRKNNLGMAWRDLMLWLLICRWQGV